MQSAARSRDLHENVQRPALRLTAVSHQELPATAGDSASATAE
jgi:hypothetical protein